MPLDKQPVVAVYGLWHLGCVTAASLAQEGFRVIGLDSDHAVIENLRVGKPPIFEPGLTELIVTAQANGLLSFTSNPAEALEAVDVMWVAFDTPVDEEDRADVGFVEQQLDAAFPHLKNGAIILISSQLPVGSTDKLRQRWQARDPEKHLTYAYSPENLRLGNALKSFRAEDRIVIGLDNQLTEQHPTTPSHSKELLGDILGRFCPRLEWMSVKSAEMTKHALNSFLAVSVAMINEIARICEQTGADAKEVERGLKSEIRIGPRAYLGPGAPFAGGTLARDLRFLVQLGATHGLETPLLTGTLASNEIHKGWVQSAVLHQLAEQHPTDQLAEQHPTGAEGEMSLRRLTGARVTILGLSYKPGTDTLRRSEAVNLGLWLVEQGAEVTFHDPVVAELPEELASQFRLTNDLTTALTGADLLVVATGWPIYREQIRPELLAETMRHLAVIDQNRFLMAQLADSTEITYLAVGKPLG
jgi:UDPglucose 6-dehydrogenase